MSTVDQKEKDLLDDGGWKSRKLWFSVFSIGMLYAGSRLAMEYPAVGGVYGEYVGGVVAVTMAMVGGNVASRWVTALHLSKVKKTKKAAAALAPAQAG